jgi:NAD(P)-dependent dehydrogenase (short-subunit alcohol dehydrogenase family)
MLTKAAALDYADKGIRVNAVCPGAIDTPILDNLTPEMRAGIVELHPMGRIGRPEDVAAVVVFLASDESAWVTGSDYLVDGGRLLV